MKFNDWANLTRKASADSQYLVGGVLFCLVVFGCGRYGPPLAPEEYAPRAVTDLQVTPTLDGVEFSWRAPGSDKRGKELREIDGYLIYRKELRAPTDIADDKVRFELVDTVPDPHLQILKEMKDDARKQGLITRKIKVDEKLLQFKYADQRLKPGSTYLYKIVPVNQGGVEGEVLGFVKLTFRGESSEVGFLARPSEE